MDKFCEIMERVAATTKGTEKLKLLRELKKSFPDAGLLLKWACDPALKFYITLDELDERLRWQQTKAHGADDGKWWFNDDDVTMCFNSVCHELSARQITGKEALINVRALLVSAPSEEFVTWACRIINKDLRAGINVSTINKVWPELIVKHEVALAETYDPDKHELEGSYIIDPKLDGLRMTTIDGVPTSRGDKEFTTVGHILSEIGEEYLDKFVFDGELMGVEDFDSASGKMRRKEKGSDKSLTYVVFDLVLREDWDSPLVSFSSRRQTLEKMFEKHGKDWPHVKLVPIERMEDPTGEQLFAARDRMIALGYEGIMIKRADAPYTKGRSDSILKCKEFHDIDGTIVGFQEGRGRHRGRLGAFLVDFGGIHTKVGSGFSDDQRDDFWHRRDQLMGKWVECMYQNRIAKTNKLRFPTFIKLRPDKDQ